VAVDTSCTPSVSSSIRSGAPVAVKAVTARFIGHYLVAALRTALLLDTLEDSCRRPPDRHGVRVLGREPVDLSQHAKAACQVSRQYCGLPSVRRPAPVVRLRGWRSVVVDGHSENCTRGARPPLTSPSRTAARSEARADEVVAHPDGGTAAGSSLTALGPGACSAVPSWRLPRPARQLIAIRPDPSDPYRRTR
jgi:hypothetical protein